jgi:hypothetical protein
MNLKGRTFVKIFIVYNGRESKKYDQSSIEETPVNCLVDIGYLYAFGLLAGSVQ